MFGPAHKSSRKTSASRRRNSSRARHSGGKTKRGRIKSVAVCAASEVAMQFWLVSASPCVLSACENSLAGTLAWASTFATAPLWCLKWAAIRSRATLNVSTVQTHEILSDTPKLFFFFKKNKAYRAGDRLRKRRQKTARSFGECLTRACAGRLRAERPADQTPAGWPVRRPRHGKQSRTSRQPVTSSTRGARQGHLPNGRACHPTDYPNARLSRQSQ